MTQQMSREELVELVAKAKEGDVAARNRVVEDNAGLAKSMARKYVGRGVPLEDLIQEGFIGLVKSVVLFDPAKDTCFTTCATYSIKKSILECLTRRSRIVRVPDSTTKIMLRASRLAAEMELDLLDDEGMSRVAAAMGLGGEGIDRIRSGLRCREAVPLADFWREMAVADSAEEEIESRDILPLAIEAIDGLGDEQRAVILMRFGLNGDEPMTYKEIGRFLGFSRSKCQIIERRALEAIRIAVGLVKRRERVGKPDQNPAVREEVAPLASGDITDSQWMAVRTVIPPRQGRAVHNRTMVNAILHKLSTGCTWKSLPKKYPHRKTVQKCFLGWFNDGTWQYVVEALRDHDAAQLQRSAYESDAARDRQTAGRVVEPQLPGQHAA